MNILEKIITFLQFKMETPTPYGWFHLLSVLLIILLIVFLAVKKFKTKRVLFVLSVIMLLFEVYKQLSFSFDGEKWEYQWYAFPFQFCSTPMYIAFIASLVKNKKVESCLYSFLATFGTVAGIAVMAYPVTVFIPEVLIDVQTMVHHGFMIVIGLTLLINGDVKLSYKTALKGLIVFAILVAIAVIVNVITYHVNFEGGLEFFYISPYHTPEIPVFDIIHGKVWYPIFLFLYLFAFTLGGLIPVYSVKLIKKLIKKSVDEN